MDTTSLEANKAVVRGLVEDVWNKGDLTALDDYATPALKEEVIGHFTQLLDAFSDVHVAIEGDLIAEGDKVVARLTVSGTHDKGPFAGAPPSSRRLSWGSIRIYRVADGKIAETWAMQDRLELMEQLGLVQPVANTVEWAGGRTTPR